jgi:hypothetical protein
VDQLDEKLAGGVPSLKDCAELQVKGPVLFNKGNVFRGRVTISNPAAEPRPLPAGQYQDCERQV